MNPPDPNETPTLLVPGEEPPQDIKVKRAPPSLAAVDWPLGDWAADPELDPYGSRMHPEFGLLLHLLRRLFFRHMRDDCDVVEVKKAAARGSVVYVQRTESLLDYLYFNTFLQSKGLPLARFANGVNTRLFAPIGRLVGGVVAAARRRRSYGGPLPDPVDSGYAGLLVTRGHPVLVFLRKGRRILAARHRPGKDVVEVLVEAQARRSQPIYLVPQVLVWERGPDRSTRGLLDVLLGDQDNPGRIRKAMHFLFSHRHSVVHMGEPVNLQDFIKEQEGLPPERVAKKLRWLLLGYLYRERKVVKGPDVRPRRWLFQRVLAEPRVRAAIQDEAAREGRNIGSVEKRAHKILDRLGADFHWDAIAFLRTILDIITSRIYDGVEFAEEDAERIREASRKGTVLLLPSHRSHFDYLLLSWLFFHHGMMPPHIAAGNNLSFWPLGPIFRRAGAYFIRRSFADDGLYQVLVNQYIRALISEGYTQEFFIEGGRSRTGKMLPAKLGLLSTYVEAMADRIVPDIQLVPVYIAYEKIVEDYSGELSGQGKKKKENTAELVRGARVLRRRFGRVYCTTNEPISLKDALALLPKPYFELDAGERKQFLKRLGSHIVAEIQDTTLVTPSTVAALVLLTHDKRGISRQLFHRRARVFSRWLEAKEANFSDAWHFPEHALDEALGMFAESKLVEILPEVGNDQQDIIALAEETAERLSLDYYKNSILYQFVPAALLCTALALDGEGAQAHRLDRLQKRFDFLLDLFQEEFTFHPDMPSTHLLGEAAQGMREQDLLDVYSPDGSEVPPLDSVEGQEETEVLIRVKDPIRAGLFFSTIRNFTESYMVVLEGIGVLHRGPLNEKELVEAILLVGRRKYLCGEVTRPEATNKVSLGNAVRHFRKMGVLVPLEGGDPGEARLGVDEAARQRFMAPMRRLIETEQPPLEGGL